jgi:hemoglobin
MRLIPCLLLAACAAAPPATRGAAPAAAPTTASSSSLYDRLGGKEAIVAVVDDFRSRVAADPRINKFFAAADMNHLRAMLIEQLCQATGGPCQYSGKDMRSAHVGLNLTAAHFDALVENITQTLDKLKVGAREKEELVGLLGSMKPDVIGQ